MPNEPKLSWGKAKRDLSSRWPKAADGTPEKPALLTNAVEADAEAEILVNLLEANGIPVMRQYDKDGTLGKVVLGFSGYGVGLYVPEPMLEDARGLIAPVDGAEQDGMENGSQTFLNTT
jgi:hypothetical protein